MTPTFLTLEQLAAFFDRYEPSAILGSRSPYTYLMIHKMGGRKAILHLMPKANSAELGWSDDFMRRAKESMALQCPNFLKIEAVGEMEDHYYVMTEFSEDPAIEQMKARLPLEPREALVAIKAVAIGFRGAHERQIIHGRLDLLNIHVNYRNFCKVCPLNLLPYRTVKSEREFYSPESLTSKGDYTVKDDIYSLGMVLYWLITGGVPSAKKHFMPSCLSKCSREVDQLIAKAIKPRAGERYTSMDDFIKAIDTVLPHAEKEKKKGVFVNTPVVTVNRTASLTYFMLVPILMLGIVMAWLALQYKTDLAKLQKTWNDNEYKLHMEKAAKEAKIIRLKE